MAHICPECGRRILPSRKKFWKNVKTGEKTPFYYEIHPRCAPPICSTDKNFLRRIRNYKRKPKHCILSRVIDL